MIIKSMKKTLSFVVMTTCLLVFAAPMGRCLPATPQINTGVAKPALRSTTTPSSLKLEGDISISKKNPKISLSLRGSEVTQVLRMFADKAGLNIIFHYSIYINGSTNASSSQTTTSSQNQSTNSNNNSSANKSSDIPSGRKVTMDLVNVPLNDAFKMVLQVTSLTYYIDKNTIVIMDATAAQTLNMAKQELTTIPVKYVDAASLATFLNKNVFAINKPGLSNGQIAVTNPSTNEILIFGTKNDYLMAKKVVAQFDVKPLEETFIVNHTTPKEMADLLCNVLFKDKGASAPVAAAAANAKGLSLGAGVVACQFGDPSSSGSSSSSSANAGSLSSLNNISLSVAYFPQNGTVSVRGGSAQQMEMIKNFVAKNDKKQPQALLEVSLIELNENGSRSFQNTWQVWSSFFSGSFNGPSGITTNPLYPNFFGGDSYSVVDPTDLSKPPLYTLSKFSGTPTATYTMNYIIQNGKGRLVANPKIIITNGEKTTIKLTSDYLSKVDANTVTSATSSVTTYTYTAGNDDGVTMDLTPYISLDGYVTLDLHPVFKSIKGTITGVEKLAGKTVLTLLDNRDIDLKKVRIKDGETLIIGGMIKEGEQKSISKIPVLGDLPGVGMFFRNSDSTKTKEELVIMITPKIIQDSEDLVSKPNVAL